MSAVDRIAVLDRRIQDRVTSPNHDRRNAAVLGLCLGVAFSTCFATGLMSLWAQSRDPWIAWPSRPAGLYRISQGVHVVTGFASVPLLLAKLWTVAPHLARVPPARTIAHAIERLSLLPLVGGSLFLVLSGTANVARWYPWEFFFTLAHRAAAWITIGALVVHVGAVAIRTRDALRRDPLDSEAVVASPTDRRTFLGGVAATAGIVAVATAGATIAPLSRVSVLAQRRPGTGPQGVPVNKSAEQAGVRGRIDQATYRLLVIGAVDQELSLSLADLRAMPARTAELPIACVEGWSTSAPWSGVPVRDLLARAGARPGASVDVESFQDPGVYSTSVLNAGHAADRDTLLALDLRGEPLHIDHGWPVRLIGPNRPGVAQTKWVGGLFVR